MTTHVLQDVAGVLDEDLLDHAEAVLRVAVRQGRPEREWAQAVLESTLLAARYGRGPLARDQRARLVNYLVSGTLGPEERQRVQAILAIGERSR